MYTAFDKFIVRTPLFPFNNTLLNNIDLDNNLFKEAIYIASNDLYNEMSKAYKGGKTDDKDIKKIETTLYKYWRRIRTRTTPYGLFSGVSIGDIKQHTETKIVFDNTIIRNIRLDMNVLYSIIHSLEKNEEIKNKILYYKNDTIYPVYDQLRFYEKDYQNNTSFKYSISSVSYSSYLNKILNHLGNGGCTIEDLISYLQNILFEVSHEDAKQFITELIDSNVLISELQPFITGGDILQNIIAVLSKYNIQNNTIHILQNIHSKLNDIKNTSDNQISNYQDVIELLDKLNISYDKKNIFQIDLYKNTNIATLDDRITHNLLAAILFVTKLNNKIRKDSNLELFKQMFSEKYGEREIDLLFATDTDVGIGYPPSYTGVPYTNDLVKNLRLPKQRENINQIDWDSTQSLLLKKITEANKGNNIEIILSDEDVNDVEIREMYPTFFCGFEIINKDESGYLLKINSVGGTSAANLISRFSHTHPDVEDLVKKIGQKEQEMERNPILEIIHLPNPRIGNVLVRSQMRKYELTIVSNSTMGEKKIPISDLKISVRNGNIILRSKKLGSIIKTAHTNAFNNKLSTIPAFNFLCDLQNDNNYLNSISLNPNFNIEFIPRIKYKNVILSSATWIFTQKKLKNHLNNGVFQDLEKWRDVNNIPQYVVFSQGDNELFINLENERGINSFVEIINKNPIIVLKEFLFDGNPKIVEDINGENYRNEFIVAFYKN